MLMTATDGKKSASLTMAVIGFIVVTLWLLLSIFSKIGHIEIRPFSGGEAMSFLSPLLLLYFGRRKEEAKVTASTTQSSETASEEEVSVK